jgi:hypothetical protein
MGPRDGASRRGRWNVNLAEIRELSQLAPRERAIRSLDLGCELGATRKMALPPGRLPLPLREEKMGIAGPLLARLHGMKAEVTPRAVGLREVGTLVTQVGEVDDFVLTTQARRKQAALARQRRKGERKDDLALQQLALALFDTVGVSRLCAAHAYWCATGARHVAIPILESGLESGDEDEFMVAAHSLRRIDPRRVRHLEGGAKDDTANSPQNPPVPSMTVIIHGTFARDREWYKPGGSFHEYVRRNVFDDVYSGGDFFFWSGRYTHAARRSAANKLVSWCADHPADRLRLMAHSHGASVVSLALKKGLRACTLIHMSPPVHEKYLPEMANVSSGRLFTVRPKIDLVVLIDGGEQDYRGTPVEPHERRIRCAFFGHSKSHAPERWKKKGIPDKVRAVCYP